MKGQQNGHNLYLDWPLNIVIDYKKSVEANPTKSGAQIIPVMKFWLKKKKAEIYFGIV